MILRRLLLALAVVGLAPIPTPAQTHPAPSLPEVVDGLDKPSILGQIDTPAVVRVGHADVRPSPTTRVFVLAAAGRPSGILIDGPATLSYGVEDRLSVPLTRRNAGRAGGTTLRDEGAGVVLTGSLRGAAIWGWNVDGIAGTPRPVPDASLPSWLTDLLEGKLSANPARDMVVSDWTGQPGYRWALLHTTGDDLVLDVDPRPTVQQEVLSRVDRIARTGPYGGRWTSESITAQPIEGTWPVTPAAEFAVVEADLVVRNPSGEAVSVQTTLRVQSLRDDLRALPLRLISEDVTTLGQRRPFPLKRLTVDGQPAEYAHLGDSLVVRLARPLAKGATVAIATASEGDLLERVGGDSYWRLGGIPWYPQPETGGLERAAFKISVETPAPFVPFAPGEIVSRTDTGPTRTVVTRLNGPMERVHLLAGKYSTFTDEADGFRVHASTYASARKDEALRVAGIVRGVRSCFTSWLGVPYPFQDLQILEMTDWGWGQAPPGMIFVTQEAFLTLARANSLDDYGTYAAGVVSRGINERLAHEVAHGWFPHVAKIVRYEENWLSESLAEYTSAVCMEQIDTRRGKDRFKRALSGWKSTAGRLGPNQSLFLSGFLGNRADDVLDRQALLYARGPLVLHAIRQELARMAGSAEEGDRLFLVWIRSYVKNFTYKTAETRHLAGILGQITKTDWQPWFDRYVYGTETPSVK